MKKEDFKELIEAVTPKESEFFNFGGNIIKLIGIAGVGHETKIVLINKDDISFIEMWEVGDFMSEYEEGYRTLINIRFKTDRILDIYVRMTKEEVSNMIIGIDEDIVLIPKEMI